MAENKENTDNDAAEQLDADLMRLKSWELKELIASEHPGIPVEVTQDEAAQLGLFEETALTQEELTEEVDYARSTNRDGDE